MREIEPPFYVDDQLISQGFIIGVVTSLDVVESKFTGEEVAQHGDFWESTNHYKKWRWSSDESLHWFLPDHKPNIEQAQFVRDHLTKKYGIKWFANGHHDCHDLDIKHRKLQKLLEGQGED